MANIAERYRSAVHARSLRTVTHKGDEGLSYLEVDILGAVGLASRDHPLGAALSRLFAGDGRAAHEIVAALTELVLGQSLRERVKLSRVRAVDMARSCLAYHRNGTCQSCGGHGKTLIPGTKTLSDHDCQDCRDPRTGQATGTVQFERNFRTEHQPLARWLVSEMERECGRIAPAAMRKLGNLMEL